MTNRKTNSWGAVLAATAVAALVAAPSAQAGGANGGKKPVCVKQCFLLDGYLNTHCFWTKGTCQAPICPESIEEGYADFGGCGVDFNGTAGLQGYLGSLLAPPRP